jgi:E3 ubiquitin-protein ligase synoviolin
VFPPPPLPDLNFATLSDEELAQLEGNERRNMEARVQCLRNINTLLNGAFVHIQQYMNITMADSNLANLRQTTPIKVENDLIQAQSSESTIQTNNEAANNDEQLDTNDDNVNLLRKRRLDHFNSPNKN